MKNVVIIQPHNIKKYSICPQRAKFNWNIPLEDYPLREALTIDTIKTIFLYTERKERTPKWKNIPGWVDRLIRNNPEKTEELYRYYKDTLTALHKWFHKDYLYHPIGGLINVPIITHFGPLHTFYSKVDIISPDHEELYIFTTNDISLIQQYNDIAMFANLWAVEKFLDVEINICVKLIVTPQKVEERRYKITYETKQRARKSLDYLINGITNNIFYPSISEHCTTCPYRMRCSI